MGNRNGFMLLHLLLHLLLAPMQKVINDTIEYTKERNVFGKSVLDNQYNHFKLAELQTELELLRALLYRITAMYVQGNDVTMLASMAKLKGGRLQRQVADTCLQMYGGMGFTLDNSASK